MADSRQHIRVQSSAERAQESLRLVLPNPGDVMIFMIFGWAFLCFFLLIGGKRILRALANLASSSDVRSQLLDGNVEILAALMIAGTVAIIVLVLFAYNYRYLFVGLLLYALQFSTASFGPLHDFAFVVKYGAIAFLAGFSILLLLKNFWRITSTPYIRLLLAYIVWIAIISVSLGGRLDDIWFTATEASMVFGFAVGWLSIVKDKESLQRFNTTLVWVGLFIAMTHATAPFLAEEYIRQSRFQSFTNRATGFAVSFAPMLLALFWASLAEKRQLFRLVFTGAALGGTLLIFWSGTRSASLALIICIGLLTLVFKARVAIYALAAAVVALVFVIVGGSFGEIDIDKLAERLQGSSDSGRFELWQRYIDAWLKSPIIGWSLTGLDSAFFSDQLISYLEGFGANVLYQKPHNAYLGMAVRFGVIGLGFLLAVLYFPLRRIKTVLTSEVVPLEERQVYVLPSVIVIFCCLSCLFEDAISGIGKGTVIGFMLFGNALVCEYYGRMLVEKYVMPARARGFQRRKAPSLAADSSVSLSPEPVRFQDS